MPLTSLAKRNDVKNELRSPASIARSQQCGSGQRRNYVLNIRGTRNYFYRGTELFTLTQQLIVEVII